jgi:Protein O-mannosyl-transferase TMEM260-like
MQKSLSCSWFAYLAVLVASGTLYAISCAPGALWQDSGLIQYRVWHHDIVGFLGLAISHPLYYIVAIGAKAFPVGTFAHRVNLVSAFAGAVAVANLYLLVRLWLGKPFPAVIAAITLAVSHTFWRHASIAETYTLWTALFLGELIAVLQYSRIKRIGYLYFLGLLNGLALAVHMLAVIPGVCYVVWVVILLGKKAVRWKHVALAALFWMVGALPYEYLIVGHVIQSGDILATLASAAFGDRWQGAVLNTHLSWQIVKENISLLLLNVPTPNALLFLAGAVALCRDKSSAALRNLVAALMLLFFVFAFRYTVADRYAFFIPFYAIASLVVGLGANAVQQRVQHKAFPVLVAGLALLPVAVYAVAPAVAARANLAPTTRGDIPYRDDMTYFLQPWKIGYTGAERFAREVLEMVPADAVIYADTTTVAPLLYAQEVQGQRPDVWIITGLVRSGGAPHYDKDTFRHLIDHRPVYVTSHRPGYCPPFVLGTYDLAKSGLLWRVIRPPAQAG